MANDPALKGKQQSRKLKPKQQVPITKNRARRAER